MIVASHPRFGSTRGAKRRFQNGLILAPTTTSQNPFFAMSSAPVPLIAAKLAGKYLTVVLDNEAYGIAVLKVREIIRMQKITPVPQMPSFVKGVINLRGRVIPVVDLRVKFGLKAEFAERTCIVVVQVKLPTEQIVQMGLIVDSVEEVVTLTNEEIEPTPDFGTKVDTTYLLGMAKVKGQVKTLLDIDRVVAPETVQAIVQSV
jgi:purine-binding chemotaxis protein CheW